MRHERPSEKWPVGLRVGDEIGAVLGRSSFASPRAQRIPLDECAQLLAGLVEVGVLVYKGTQDDPADGPG
ncbi:MAG: hypothetical protein H0T57_13130, partial [Rubrobacter sp.]|nr:hypothetical protein [Rubrobacter sp.]